jgi:O-6-methylguanine DNA methyltransferase
MILAAIRTSLGVFTARFSERGLAALDFPGRGAQPALPSPNEVLEWVALTRNALDRVLSGEAPETLPPLDLHRGTEFQRTVWRALLNIPPGQTKTYAEVAAEIGDPKAARAVGGACGANSIPVLVPCHRVLASGGKIGGFSAGLAWKRRLLAIEGVCHRELELPV